MGIEEVVSGKIYEEKINPEDADKFATVFGEGSPGLTNLIRFCILNDINTFASCKGHPEDMNPIEALVETGYLAFRIQNNFDLAYFISELAKKIPGITVALDFGFDFKRSLSVYVPARKKGMSEVYFDAILKALEEYVLNPDYVPSPETEKVVKYIYSVPSNEVIEINHKGFKKLERQGMYLKQIAKCKNHKKNLLHKKYSDSMSELDEFLNTQGRKK